MDTTIQHTVPKIIHQIWIGPKPPPTNLMDTWKNMNPDFKYILWNEQRIAEDLDQRCSDKIEL
jgi:mannosyltransferase OCH1-like enzyme